MFFRIGALIFLLVCICNNANALESCKGKRVFSCSSLPKETATKRKCHLFYQCREVSSGEACFQCQLSINKLTRGLCEENGQAQCLKKDV